MFQLYLRAHISNIHYIFLIYYIIVNHYYKFILYNINNNNIIILFKNNYFSLFFKRFSYLIIIFSLSLLLENPLPMEAPYFAPL